MAVAEAPNFWKRPNRQHALILAMAVAVVLIALGSLILSGRAGVLLLDLGSKHFPYPLTFQNIMHLVFFVGLSELFVRWRAGLAEMEHLKARYLPEDEQTILRVKELAPIRKRVARAFDNDTGFLPSLINLSILQFQSSRSIDQAAAVMNSHLELISHRVDLSYGVVRFVSWLVPTIGFIGTVYSLGASLAEAGDPSKTLDIKTVAATLAVGFDTTMVALVESAVLVFLTQIAQSQEEMAVNRAGDYTLRNLINRLYAG